MSLAKRPRPGTPTAGNDAAGPEAAGMELEEESMMVDPRQMFSAVEPGGAGGGRAFGWQRRASLISVRHEKDGRYTAHQARRGRARLASQTCLSLLGGAGACAEYQPNSFLCPVSFFNPVLLSCSAADYCYCFAPPRR